jgi:hypothetical protein
MLRVRSPRETVREHVLVEPRQVPRGHLAKNRRRRSFVGGSNESVTSKQEVVKIGEREGLEEDGVFGCRVRGSPEDTSF